MKSVAVDNPVAIVLKNIYPGYYGYFYPKKILYKDGKPTEIFYRISQKYPDLDFYDFKIFLDKSFRGLLLVKGSLIGNNPITDLIEVRDFFKYRIVKREVMN
jgi:hypothetical protein